MDNMNSYIKARYDDPRIKNVLTLRREDRPRVSSKHVIKVNDHTEVAKGIEAYYQEYREVWHKS
jgi:hypothetical protein